MRVDLKTRQKNGGKSGLLLGRRAIAGRGPRAAGPSGRRAAGPSRAAGPLGRLGPRAVGRWAAGLLLAKPP